MSAAVPSGLESGTDLGLRVCRVCRPVAYLSAGQGWFCVLGVCPVAHNSPPKSVSRATIGVRAARAAHPAHRLFWLAYFGRAFTPSYPKRHPPSKYKYLKTL